MTFLEIRDEVCDIYRRLNSNDLSVTFAPTYEEGSRRISVRSGLFKRLDRLRRLASQLPAAEDHAIRAVEIEGFEVSYRRSLA